MNDNNGSWKRTAILFLTSQTISLLGSSLVQYALMWHVTLATQSGTMMTIFIICGFLPTFFLSPFAGVWADRYDRKKLIIFSDGLIAAVTLVMFLVFRSGYRSIPLLFAVSAVRAVGSAIQQPAVGAILPQMVPPEHLTRVNGINGSIQSAMMLVSPVLSGALLTVTALENIFLIDIVTAAVAIGLLSFFLRVAPHEGVNNPSGKSYFHDMRDGFRYIRDHRYLVSFFIYLALLYVFVSPAAFLTPLQTARTFGRDVWRLTAIEIVFSVGMMAGGALIAVWGGLKNRIHTMIASNVLMALCTIALAFSPYFWLYLIFMGIFGIALPFLNTPSAVLIQTHVEEIYMGRVFSVMTMISSALMPLSMLVFGPLADIIRIEWILMGTGVLMLVSALRALTVRRLVEAG